MENRAIRRLRNILMKQNNLGDTFITDFKRGARRKLGVANNNKYSFNKILNKKDIYSYYNYVSAEVLDAVILKLSRKNRVALQVYFSDENCDDVIKEYVLEVVCPKITNLWEKSGFRREDNKIISKTSTELKYKK